MIVLRSSNEMVWKGRFGNAVSFVAYWISGPNRVAMRDIFYVLRSLRRHVWDDKESREAKRFHTSCIVPLSEVKRSLSINALGRSSRL